MKIIKKPKLTRIGERLALRPATLPFRDPVAYAAALKILG
jgi:hypothetical protein